MELNDEISQLTKSFYSAHQKLIDLIKVKDDAILDYSYFDNIKCYISHYLSNVSFMESNIGQMVNSHGLYVNQTIKVINQKRVTIIGDCIGIVKCTEPKPYHIRVTDHSKVTVYAANGAQVEIVALDKADVVADPNDSAYISVRLFGSATCTGADKVTQECFAYDKE